MTRRARLRRSHRKSVRILNRKYRNSSEAQQLVHVPIAAIDRWLFEFHGRSMEPRSKVCCIVRAAKLQCLTTNFWEVLCIILVLTLLVDSGVSEQPDGFISIDCGGPRGTRRKDPSTGLEWQTDENFLDSEVQLVREGVAVSADVELSSDEGAPRDNAEQLTTAMVFIPRKTSKSKFCYNLDVSETNHRISRNYLVRVMFPSKKLNATKSGPVTDHEKEELNSYGTRFYFTVDSTYISTIELRESEPQTVELVLNSLDSFVYICLVPLEDKSSMPAISTIELRPLSLDLYRDKSDDRDDTDTGDSTESIRRTYLMTVSRLNFGGNSSLPAVRYPHDRHDRLWSAVKIPREESSEIKSSRSSDHFDHNGTWHEDPRGIPGEVIESAWEGVNMNSKISFKLNISAARAYRPFTTFYFRIFFHDVGPRESDNTTRFVNIYDDDRKETWGPNTRVPPIRAFSWYNYKRTFSHDLVTFRITRNATSIHPAMVNAVDLLGEFEAVTQRTTWEDVSAIEGLLEMFEEHELEALDIVGDPCLPVPWSWLVCSIEIPPRITQIVLAGKGGKGKSYEGFVDGSLGRLTILDVSNNNFSGGLPKSLVGIVTLRELNISTNNLSGDLPLFENKLVNLETLSFRNNRLTGDVSSLVKVLGSTVSTLDLSMNLFNGSIPKEIGSLRNLKILDLSYNRFSNLSNDLFKLTKLQILNLQNNSLQGSVPDGIWLSENNPKSSRRTLQINLGGNNFTQLNLTTWFQTVFASDNVNFTYEVSLVDNQIGTVELPRQDEAMNQSLLCGPKISNFSVLLGGNPYCKNLLKHAADMTLTERYLCRSSGTDLEFCKRGENNNEKLLIISLVVSGLVVLLMACVLVFSLRKMWKRMTDLRQIQEALAKDHVRPPIFKYEDVKAGTRKFSRENELGKGAFGAVYKAELPDQSIVAVKVLFKSEQTTDDFLKEIVAISGIKHRHLIELKGCCVRDSRRMLVYEYAENGNLDQALWGDKTSEVVLTWPQRLKICVGVAKGLSYLHEELQQAIIHRDIKPQNILLDKDWNAKIADFGLARPMEEDGSQMATLNIGGTRGYFPPEYATHGLITEKLDVYSYGIVVLEIVSGRRCIHFSSHTDEIYIKNWAFKAYKAGGLTEIAEQSMLATAPGDEIESVLKTALLCVQEDPEKRPTMSQVVNLLTGNSSNLAIDIVSELKGQPILYDHLFDSTTFTTQLSATQYREDLALLRSSSSSVSNGMIELRVSGR